MTTNTTETPTVAEFDQWTDVDEQAALATAAETVRVRHIIKNNEYWALAPSGRIYKLPLLLSISDFEALSGAQDDTESVRQVRRILTTFAGEQQAEALTHEPMQVAFNLLSDYGATIAKAQGATLGKSADSTTSSTATTA